MALAGPLPSQYATMIDSASLPSREAVLEVHSHWQRGCVRGVTPRDDTGVIDLYEGDPSVARPTEYRFYPWIGLTFSAQVATKVTMVFAVFGIDDGTM